MGKVILIFFTIIFICLPSIGLAKIDDAHVKSIVQIKIWDKLMQTYKSSGSGIFIDSIRTILTNYHVVEDAIINSERYVPIACLTKDATSLPDCSYVFSVTPSEPRATEELDLALLMFDGIIVEGNYKSFWYLSLEEMTPFFRNSKNINISIYG